ncbi:helix-turn-helix transcriptional regulator [bacterium]|jgi:DNA-binding CsgD family transcriptional regulator|nr:helix-turn-helix transcriptional regulator [bacterium]
MSIFRSQNNYPNKPSYFLSFAMGCVATLFSFIWVSIVISIFATINVFKNNGAMNLNSFYMVMDTVIIYFAPVIYLMCTVSVAAFTRLRWNKHTLEQIFVFGIGAAVSLNLVEVNFSEAIKIDGFYFFRYMLVFVESYIGFKYGPMVLSVFNTLRNQRLLRKVSSFGISKRESEILEQLLKGSTNKEIGDALYIEEGTVKVHLKSIYKKLNVSSRFELMKVLKFAIR